MGNILSLFSGTHEISSKVAEVIIAPLDDEGAIDSDLGGEKILQYWPESVDEDVSANWQERNTPGSPVPLLQWVSGSGRNFSFETVFTRDMNGEIGSDVEEDKFNVDVDAAIAWLRMLCLNDYKNVGDVKYAASAPPVLWVLFRGTAMGYNTTAAKSLGTGGSNENGIYCVMTQMSTSRKNWFQDGQQRTASVSLSFSEVIQVGQGIYPYGRTQLKSFANKYTRTPSK